MKKIVSILLLLAAIGFFVITIITRQVLYASIGFLYLFCGLSLGRQVKSNSGKESDSNHDSEQSTEDKH